MWQRIEAQAQAEGLFKRRIGESTKWFAGAGIAAAVVLAVLPFAQQHRGEGVATDGAHDAALGLDGKEGLQILDIGRRVRVVGREHVVELAVAGGGRHQVADPVGDAESPWGTLGGGTPDWGVDFSTPTRGIPVWAVLKEIGAEGVRERIRRHNDFARMVATRARAEDELELLSEPQLSIACFRYRPAGWVPPPVGENDNDGATELSSSEMLRRPQFYLLWTVFMCSALAGLMVIYCIKLFGIDALQHMGVVEAGAITGTAMAWYAIFNGSGRIAWGTISDRTGRETAITLMVARVVISAMAVMAVKASKMGPSDGFIGG